MRRVIVVAVIGATAGAACAGCGAPGSSGTGGAGGFLPTTVVIASTGSAGPCHGALPEEGVCEPCLESACCDQVMACTADATCDACLGPGAPDPDACLASAAVAALRSCAHERCFDTCASWRLRSGCDAPAVAPSKGDCFVADGNLYKCNPVTSDGCDAALGEACDVWDISFECFTRPKTAGACGDCGKATGDEVGCAGGYSCVNQRCARYCCTDEDCGTGVCRKENQPNPAVGVCSDG